MALRRIASRHLSCSHPRPHTQPPVSWTLRTRNRPETGTATSRSGPRFLSPTSVPPYCSGPEVESTMEAKKPALTAAPPHIPRQLGNLSPAWRRAGGRLPLPGWRTHGGLLTDSDLLLSLGLEPGQLWVGGVTPRGPSGSSCEHEEGQSLPLVSASAKSTPVSVYICAGPRGSKDRRQEHKKQGQAWTRTPCPGVSLRWLAGWLAHSHREAPFLSSG